MAVLDAIPPGAFGVWDRAPVDGLFAFFTLEPTLAAGEEDRKRFAQVIGRPVLAMAQTDRGTTTDAGAILNMLAGTAKGEHSANPSAEGGLSDRLAKLKNAVRASFADIQLPRTILPQLVCWMEVRKGNK
jgi:hypothetical protein